MQFEYKVYTPKAGTSPEYEQEVVYSFNTLGAEGWELTAMDGAFFIFKRPKEETAKEMFADITDAPGVTQKHEYKPLHKDEILMKEQPCICIVECSKKTPRSEYHCPKHDASVDLADSGGITTNTTMFHKEV
jgi:hypothetical protein